jgi:5-methylcytosine-specific restriction endonuclease McrA
LPRWLRELVIERDGYLCGICALDVDPLDVHLDHIFPVSKGGDDHPDNLRVTHSICNIKKGAKV